MAASGAHGRADCNRIVTRTVQDDAFVNGRECYASLQTRRGPRRDGCRAVWPRHTGAGRDRNPMVAFDDRQAQRQGQRARREIQCEPEGLQGHRGLQGPVRRVDDRGDRRVSRRQSAADRPGVRGGHGHDDGGQGRGQAGLPADGRGRRDSSTRKRSSARSTAYYSDTQGQLLSMPFNSSTQVLYINKDAFKKAGLDPNRPPKTWPEVGDAAEKLKASGMACGFTTGWQSWVQLESFSAWHNMPFATKENGFGGLDTRLEFNGPVQVQAHPDARRLGEEGSCSPTPDARTSRWPSSRAANADDHDVQRLVREHQGQRQVRLGRGHAALLGRRQGRAAEHDHRRRDAVGAEPEGPGRVQGRREVLHLPVLAGDPGGLAPVDRLRADHAGGLRADARSRASTTRTRAPTLRSRSSATSRRRRTRRACGWATSCRSATSSTRSWSRSGAGRRRPRQALDDAVRRGNEQLERFQQGQPVRSPQRRVSSAPPRRPRRRSRSREQWKSASSSVRRWLPYALVAPQIADHAGLLLLAGGAGALAVVAGPGRVRASHAVRLVRQFPRPVQRPALPGVVPGHGGVLGAGRGHRPVARAAARRVRRPRRPRRDASTRRC